MSRGKRKVARERGSAAARSNGSHAPTPRQQASEQREHDVDSGRHDQKKVKKDGEREKLPLKSNGELVDVSHALGTLEMLRTMQRVDPMRFEVLVALAEGRPQDVGPERIAQFRREERIYLVDGEDRLCPEITNLLASSLEVRDNSYVLVQPFRMKTGEERDVADAALDDFNQRLVDLFAPKPGRGDKRRR